MARLSTTIFGCLALTAGAATLTLGAIQRHRLNDLLTNLSQRQRATAAQGLADQTLALIQRELRAVEGLALVVEARAPDMDASEVHTLLAAHRNRYNTNEIIVAGDAEGIGIVADHHLPGGAVGGTDYSDRGYFKQLKLTGRSAVSPVEMGRRSQSPNIHIAAPVFRNSKLAGYITTGLALTRLRDSAVRFVERTEGARAVIIDSAGTVVVDTSKPPARTIVRAPPLAVFEHEVASLAQLRKGHDENGNMVEAGAVGVTVAGSPWTVLVIQPQDVVLAAKRAADRGALLAALAVLAASLFAAFALSRWIARPIANLLGLAASVDGKYHNIKKPEHHRFDPKEAVDLSLVICEMIGRLRSHAGDLEARVVERTRELETARNEALEASQTKSAFIANMSHEIRTPMNGVLGMTQLLLDSVQDNDHREYAEAAHVSGQAMLTLLNDLLDFSKIESGAMSFESLPFMMADVVDDVTLLFRTNADKKGVEFLPRVRSSAALMVLGDQGRVRQILSNLVGNALKFTSEGHVAIDVSAEENNDKLRFCIAVSDTGIGIPDDRRSTIFDTFAQADVSTTRQFGGTGLGLTIVRRLAQMMNGSVEVDSKVGVGSTFKVQLELPLAPATHQTKPQPGTAWRVLIVSNKTRAAAHLKSQFEDLGAEASCMEAEVSAMDVLNQRQSTLIVLDCDLPIEAAKIAQAAPQSRIVRWAGVGVPSRNTPGVMTTLRRPARTKRLVSLLDPNRRPTGDQAIVRPNVQGRLLVVEDNRINAKIAQRMLEKMGLSVQLASDGLEALDALSKSTFDLVFMDCQMPNMDGFEATRKIREMEHLANLPVVALTANALAEDRQRCLDAGMNDHVAKPLTREALQSAINRWVSPTSASNDARAPSGAGDLSRNAS